MNDENTHRYGDEQTSLFPSGFGTTRPDPAPAAFAAPPVATSPRRRGRTAGVLVAALVLGGAGGVAGAAGYDAANDDPAAATGTGTTGAAASPLGTSATTDEVDAPAPDGSPEAVAKSVLPSVVMINVRDQSGNGGSGSGVILSADGEILTNNHVVEVAEGGGEISVSFNDGSSTTASIVGTDPVTDLAVIQADDVSGLTAARIGDSDTIDVGEGVVAIGSPFGLEATVTSGIVSSLNRPVSVGGSGQGVEATTYPAIQTDAAINPGNSGGPLVNLAGQVVGINSSIRTSASSVSGEGGSIGLGFAIPISKVLPIVEQLRNDETPTHARLGVTVSESVNDEGLVIGARIETVAEGSAGDEAGLEAGDVVTRVDDQAITGTDSLVATVRGYRPGDEVRLTVVRDGETQQLSATLDSDQDAADS